MKHRTGKKGAPPDVRNVPELAEVVAEVDGAEADVLTAIREHAAEPTQRRTLDLLSAQLRLASLRAHLARRAGDDAVAAKESELAIKFAKSRDDAAKLLWADELSSIHAAVTRVGGVAAAIAAELEAELGADDTDHPEPAPEAP